MFIFMHIHKYSQVIKANYEKQKNEITKTTLLQKKQELTHQLYALHNRSQVKQFALAQKMEPVSLNQIKRLNAHEYKQTT